MILKGKGGIQYNLEAAPFAQGGEGQIFNINDHPDKVAKLYKAGKITPDHERKLLKMVITPPEQDVLDQIAWPLDVLYDNDKFVGFIMRKFKLNEDLNVIYEYGSSAKYPEMTWGNKIRIAKNFLATTDWDIETVAWQSGFNSVSYFIKLFREHTGVTPLNYRRSQANYIL